MKIKLPENTKRTNSRRGKSRSNVKVRGRDGWGTVFALAEYNHVTTQELVQLCDMEIFSDKIVVNNDCLECFS